MRTAIATRRDRVRAETTAEIKERAWSLMADAGADALSLRAVARQMGMAPSALYRYFPSRNELLTALIVDGYNSLAEALSAAYDKARAGAHALSAAETFGRVAKAYRRWALDHPTEFGLIFSASIPGYAGNEQTTAASARSSDVLLGVMVDMVDEGEFDLEWKGTDLTPELVQKLQKWSAQGGRNLPVPALAAAMWSYATLHGAVSLEVNRHLPPELLGSEELFESAIHNVVRSFARPVA
jgi:AcrR family transcriptional regulator